ncbi:hypothetical protein CCR85_08610 [Rhodothalassium salexigens]|nr:hypothetical protein [Rhodothalassium salexigens]MBK5921330.1 hypothetical protein [Rhodothalassium salexigens]
MSVRADGPGASAGRVAWVGADGRALSARCRLGRGGVVAADAKREGDGATPAGRWPLRRLYYRADRLTRPETALATTALDRLWSWCDAPDHPAYNRRLDAPPAASHERLWRADRRYDLIVPLGYNDDPPVPGLGSAIFLHLTDTPDRPTAGCVAMDRDDLLALLASLTPDSVMVIDAP